MAYDFVQFRVNKKVIKDVLDDVEYDIEKASANPRIKQMIGEKVKQYANPFVPKRSGALRESAHIVNHARQVSITYGSRGKTNKYAAHQYYADDATWKRTTPGTHSYWMDYVLSPGAYKYQLLTAYIQKIMSAEVKKNGQK